jgi:acetoacetate decarboxylase
MIAPPDGLLYRDAHYFAVDVEVDAERASRWVPRPLRLSLPAIGTLFTAYFPECSFGSVYREAGVFLHVEHRRTRAVHCPWMMVDDDVALILGRELLGYPKKLGDISFSLEGERIVTRASRRGTTLLAMRGTLGARLDGAPPFLGRPHRNVRSAIGLAIPWLVAFTPDERAREVRRVDDFELRVSGSARDPLHELGVGRVLHARLHRVDVGRGTPPRPVGIVSPRAHLERLLVRVR